MPIIILNIIGAISVGIGMFHITDSYIIAILSVIIGNGAPFLWFLHNIWYVIFEFIKLGYLSVYGYCALIVYVLIILISFTSIKKKKITNNKLDDAFKGLGEE